MSILPFLLVCLFHKKRRKITVENHRNSACQQFSSKLRMSDARLLILFSFAIIFELKLHSLNFFFTIFRLHFVLFKIINTFHKFSCIFFCYWRSQSEFFHSLPSHTNTGTYKNLFSLIFVLFDESKLYLQHFIIDLPWEKLQVAI